MLTEVRKEKTGKPGERLRAMRTTPTLLALADGFSRVLMSLPRSPPFFSHFSFNLLPLSPSSLNTLSSPRCLTRRARPPSECSARPRLPLLRCGAKGRERRANENQNDDGLTSKSSLAAAVEWHLFLSLSCSLAHLASFSLISFAISQQQARRQRRRARR